MPCLQLVQNTKILSSFRFKRIMFIPFRYPNKTILTSHYTHKQKYRIPSAKNPKFFTYTNFVVLCVYCFCLTMQTQSKLATCVTCGICVTTREARPQTFSLVFTKYYRILLFSGTYYHRYKYT